MTIGVCVAWVAPGVEWLVDVRMDDGATVSQAIAGSGILARIDWPAENLRFAIFGQAADAATLLADGDRIEITRPLQVDAKTARRARANATPRPRKSGPAKPNP